MNLQDRPPSRWTPELIKEYRRTMLQLAKQHGGHADIYQLSLIALTMLDVRIKEPR